MHGWNQVTTQVRMHSEINVYRRAWDVAFTLSRIISTLDSHNITLRGRKVIQSH